MTKIMYPVYQTIDIISGETGATIDCDYIAQYYNTHQQAQARANKLQAQIGKEIYKNGNGDYGILRAVEYYSDPITTEE